MSDRKDESEKANSQDLDREKKFQAAWSEYQKSDSAHDGTPFQSWLHSARIGPFSGLPSSSTPRVNTTDRSGVRRRQRSDLEGSEVQWPEVQPQPTAREPTQATIPWATGPRITATKFFMKPDDSTPPSTNARQRRQSDVEAETDAQGSIRATNPWGTGITATEYFRRPPDSTSKSTDARKKPQ